MELKKKVNIVDSMQDDANRRKVQGKKIRTALPRESLANQSKSFTKI